jgi:hypothetical protein
MDGLYPRECFPTFVFVVRGPGARPILVSLHRITGRRSKQVSSDATSA